MNSRLNRTRLRAALVTSLLACSLPAVFPLAANADLASEAAALQASIEAETARISKTGAGVADAQARFAALQAKVEQRESSLATTQNKLIKARIHLSKLEKRAALADKTLSRNLIANYEVGEPTLASIVIDAKSFADLMDQMTLVKSVNRQNARVLTAATDARRKVKKQEAGLQKLRVSMTQLVAQAAKDRNQADVVRNALLRTQEAQLAKRNGSKAKLAKVRGKIAALERQQAAAARATASMRVASAGSSSSSRASAPAAATSHAPASNGNSAVAKVVAAANQIAGTPYVWGGGHGGGNDSGYDCSGSLSYALAAAGLLSTPLDSTGFMSWGEAGPGKHITVYANAGHAYMYVDGRRFDTSALRSNGTRWTSEARSNAGFVARHPPGL